MTERTPKTNKAVGKPRRRYSLRRGGEGQAALEFMLILPIFILLFLLVVDLGMLMYEYVSLANAVREGARYGSVNCGNGECAEDKVKTRVIQRSGGILADTPDDQNKVTVSWVDNNPPEGLNYGQGDSVVVRVNHPYSFLFFPGVTLPVVSCADMRLEQTDLTTTLPKGVEC